VIFSSSAVNYRHLARAEDLDVHRHPSRNDGCKEVGVHTRRRSYAGADDDHIRHPARFIARIAVNLKAEVGLESGCGGFVSNVFRCTFRSSLFGRRRGHFGGGVGPLLLPLPPHMQGVQVIWRARRARQQGHPVSGRTEMRSG